MSAPPSAPPSSAHGTEEKFFRGPMSERLPVRSTRAGHRSLTEDPRRRAASHPRHNDNSPMSDGDCCSNNSNEEPAMGGPSRGAGFSGASGTTARSYFSYSDRSTSADRGVSSKIWEGLDSASSISDESLLGDNFKETTDKIFEGISSQRDYNQASSSSDGSSSALVYNLLAELGRRTDFALNSRVPGAERDVRENNNRQSDSMHSSQDDLDESLVSSSSNNTVSKSSTNESISTASNASTDSSTTVSTIRESSTPVNGAGAVGGDQLVQSPADETSSKDTDRSGADSPSVSSLVGASSFYLNSAIGSSRQELAQLYKDTHCNPFHQQSAANNAPHSSSSGNNSSLDSPVGRREGPTSHCRGNSGGPALSPRITVPTELPPHVLKPGLYSAHYGPHGYEIVMLEYKIKEITLLKVIF